MAQSVSLQSSSSVTRLLFGFIAGFVATLIFHQIGLLLLRFVGMTPNMPYNMNSVPPFAVPQFISLSFWGGVWGIIFVLIVPRPQSGWLLDRRHHLRRDLSDSNRLVHRAPAEGSAGSRCLPGPRHLYRADSQWPVGARDGAISELDAGIGRSQVGNVMNNDRSVIKPIAGAD
jgi:hypothetical protein